MSPTTKLNHVIVACSVLALLPGRCASACSFCPPDLSPSLWKELDQAHSGVLAELIKSPDSQSSSSVSRYRVNVVLKSEHGIKPGDEVNVPLNVQSPLGSVHLLLAGGDSSDWRSPRGISKPMREFLITASKLPEVDKSASSDARVQRLAFALPHLVSRDQQIADSVYGEFVAAPDSAVKQLGPILNHRKLKAWIELEPVSDKHRRLMFTLLGVCGNADDRPFVKAALDQRLEREDSFELDAIIAAYLTLSGGEGLVDIDGRLLKPTNVSLETRRAVARALRFHVDNEAVIAKRRILSSCRMLLLDPKTADYVLGDLARWKDWESLDQVLKLQRQAGENRWLQEPIAQYLKACPLPEARSALAAFRKPELSSND